MLVDFLYADIGGTTTVLTSIVLGLAARTALPAGAGTAAGVLPAAALPVPSARPAPAAPAACRAEVPAP